MELFRLSHTAHADLSGRGGLYGAGRWHKKGSLVCYGAASRSLCVLERLVHESLADIPELVMMTFWVPDDVSIIRYTARQLPEGWDQFPDAGAARTIGQTFLDEQNSLLLQVPSAVVSDEYNYVINPVHPDVCRIQTIDIRTYHYDPRLKKMLR